MSAEFIEESVPGFIRRIGDRVLEGSNNSTMVFGTDRAARYEADMGKGYGNIDAEGSGLAAGSWHIMVGRKSENPNFDSDSAYIYLSMKTDADKVMGTENSPAVHGVNTNGTSAIMAKADVTRFIARENMKLVVGKTSFLLQDGEIVIDSPNIRFGAASKLSAQDLFKLIKDLLLQHKHPSAVGPTGPAMPDSFVLKANTGFLDIVNGS